MGNIKRAKHGPEWFIQRDLITFLKARNWHIERLIGNALQMGVPDLNICRPDHGERWIDVKRPDKSYSFTDAQKRKWPLWEAAGRRIWIITAATEAEYAKLFQPPNWRDYWKPSWGVIPDIDALMSQIELDNTELLTEFK